MSGKTDADFEAIKELETDRNNLERYINIAPSRMEILSAVNLWQKPPASRRPNRVYVISSKIAAILLLFLAVIVTHWLSLRGQFDYRATLFTEQSSVWVALGLLTVLWFAGLNVFRRAPWQTLLVAKTSASYFTQVSLLKTASAKLIAIVELMSLTLASLKAGSLCYYLYQLRLTQPQLAYISLSLLATIIWFVWQAYHHRHTPYQTFWEWSSSSLQTKVTSRKQKAQVFLTAFFVLAILMPLTIALLNSANNAYFNKEWGQLVVADNEDLSLPPENLNDGLFDKSNFVTTSATRLIANPPATVTGYQQIVQSWKLDEAITFAKNLGFDPATIQQNDITDAYIFNRADKARLILSRKIKGLWSYNYDPVPNELTLPGNDSNFAHPIPYQPTLARQTANSIAVDFLQKGQLFNIAYQAEPDSVSANPTDNVTGIKLKFIQTWDNQPIYGPAAEVVLDSDGKVLAATSNVLPLEKIGNYTLDSQQQVLQKLNDHNLAIYAWQRQYVNNSAGNNLTSSRDSGICAVNPTQTTSTTTQPRINYQVGQNIDVTGDFDAIIYHSMDQQRPDHHVASLVTMQANNYYIFYVEGPKVPDMVIFDSYRLQVTGKITATVPQTWKNDCSPEPETSWSGYKLEVTSFSETPVNQERFNFLGKITFQTLGNREYQVMVDDNGTRYIDQAFENSRNLQPDPQAYLNQAKLQNQLAVSQWTGDMKLATQLQTTGKTIEGVPVVKMVGSISYKPDNSRSDVQPHQPAIYPIPSPDILDGSAIQVKEVQLGYFAQGVDSLQNMQPNAASLMVMPTYRILGDYNMPNSQQLAGHLEVTLPATTSANVIK